MTHKLRKAIRQEIRSVLGERKIGSLSEAGPGKKTLASIYGIEGIARRAAENALKTVEDEFKERGSEATPLERQALKHQITRLIIGMFRDRCPPYPDVD